MAKDATLQVRLDARLKSQADEVFHRSGITLSEAVRRFVEASVRNGSAVLPGDNGVSGQSTVHQPEIADEQRVSGFGMFSAYADETKRARERDAWETAAARKHALEGGESR